MASRRATIAVAALLSLAVVVTPERARANPRPLPFTYPYETLPEDSLEIEQYVDYTPVRVQSTNPDGSTSRTFDGNYLLQTEIEYGITDRLELGTYVVFAQAPSSDEPSMHFEGIKERLRYRLKEQGELPVDIAFYLEGAEFHDEYELEEKVILGKRVGNLRMMANVWVEQSFVRGHDKPTYVYNPTVGFTYQFVPQFFAGIEYWARGKFGGPNEDVSGVPSVDRFNGQTHHFVGPAVSLQFGRFWWSLGVYARADHLGHSSEPGDAVGKVWVRSVIGLEL